MKPLKRSQKIKKRVLVAMSGGVDSSVAAFLLKKKDYEVIGVTMDFGLKGITHVGEARRVARQLGIRHYVFSFAKMLKEKVIAQFLKEYISGRTPNPCIRCNQHLKFGVLVKKAKELGCGYLATGHYAGIVRNRFGEFSLRTAKDKIKDQSYFLFRIPKKSLKSILFPLGNYTKDQVRIIANKNKIRIENKPESQDICFIPHGNYKEFLIKKFGNKILRPGPILDLNKNMLGQHKGIAFYTVGQRQGLGIAYRYPLYVLKILPKNNTLVVGSKKDVYQRKLIAKELRLLNLKTLPKTLEVMAKIRYNHLQAKATILPISKSQVYIVFQRPQWAITPGQSVVFYKKGVVLGGATIEGVID